MSLDYTRFGSALASEAQAVRDRNSGKNLVAKGSSSGLTGQRYVGGRGQPVPVLTQNLIQSYGVGQMLSGINAFQNNPGHMIVDSNTGQQVRFMPVYLTLTRSLGFSRAEAMEALRPKSAIRRVVQKAISGWYEPEAPSSQEAAKQFVDQGRGNRPSPFYAAMESLSPAAVLSRSLQNSKFGYGYAEGASGGLKSLINSGDNVADTTLRALKGVPLTGAPVTSSFTGYAAEHGLSSEEALGTIGGWGRAGLVAGDIASAIAVGGGAGGAARGLGGASASVGGSILQQVFRNAAIGATAEVVQNVPQVGTRMFEVANESKKGLGESFGVAVGEALGQYVEIAKSAVNISDWSGDQPSYKLQAALFLLSAPHAYSGIKGGINERIARKYFDLTGLELSPQGAETLARAAKSIERLPESDREQVKQSIQRLVDAKDEFSMRQAQAAVLGGTYRQQSETGGMYDPASKTVSAQKGKRGDTHFTHEIEHLAEDKAGVGPAMIRESEKGKGPLTRKQVIRLREQVYNDVMKGRDPAVEKLIDNTLGKGSTTSGRKGLRTQYAEYYSGLVRASDGSLVRVDEAFRSSAVSKETKARIKRGLDEGLNYSDELGRALVARFHERPASMVGPMAFVSSILGRSAAARKFARIYKESGVASLAELARVNPELAAKWGIKGPARLPLFSEEPPVVTRKPVDAPEPVAVKAKPKPNQVPVVEIDDARGPLANRQSYWSTAEGSSEIDSEVRASAKRIESEHRQSLLDATEKRTVAEIVRKRIESKGSTIRGGKRGLRLSKEFDWELTPDEFYDKYKSGTSGYKTRPEVILDEVQKPESDPVIEKSLWSRDAKLWETDNGYIVGVKPHRSNMWEYSQFERKQDGTYVEKSFAAYGFTEEANALLRMAGVDEKITPSLSRRHSDETFKNVVQAAVRAGEVIDPEIAKSVGIDQPTMAQPSFPGMASQVKASLPLRVYHGTKAKLSRATQLKMTGKGFVSHGPWNVYTVDRQGLWFTPDDEFARQYGEKVFEADIYPKKIIDAHDLYTDFIDTIERVADDGNPPDWLKKFASDEDSAKQLFYDATETWDSWPTWAILDGDVGKAIVAYARGMGVDAIKFQEEPFGNYGGYSGVIDTYAVINPATPIKHVKKRIMHSVEFAQNPDPQSFVESVGQKSDPLPLEPMPLLGKVTIVHYSPKELDIVQVLPPGQNSPANSIPAAYFYVKAMAGVESLVTSGAKFAYQAEIDAGRIYNVATDPLGLVAEATAGGKVFASVEQGFVERMLSAGFDGYVNHSPTSAMPNVLKLFRDTAVEKADLPKYNSKFEAIIPVEFITRHGGDSWVSDAPFEVKRAYSQDVAAAVARSEAAFHLGLSQVRYGAKQFPTPESVSGTGVYTADGATTVNPNTYYPLQVQIDTRTGRPNMETFDRVVAFAGLLQEASTQDAIGVGVLRPAKTRDTANSTIIDVGDWLGHEVMAGVEERVRRLGAQESTVIMNSPTGVELYDLGFGDRATYLAAVDDVAGYLEGKSLEVKLYTANREGAEIGSEPVYMEADWSDNEKARKQIEDQAYRTLAGEPRFERVREHLLAEVSKVRERYADQERVARSVEFSDPDERRLWDELNDISPDVLGKNPTQGFASNVLSALQMMPPPESIDAMVHGGRAGVGWYEDSAAAIKLMFGDDANRVAALIAATSPRSDTTKNLLMAMRVLKTWNDRGRPTDYDAVKAMFAPENGVYQMVNIIGRVPNSIKALIDPDSTIAEFSGKSPAKPLDQRDRLSGMKVESFRRNLTGDLSAFTADTWMGRLWAGADFSRRADYVAILHMGRVAADRLGTAPANVQESLWSFIRTSALKMMADPEFHKGQIPDRLAEFTVGDYVSMEDYYSLVLKDKGVKEAIEAAGGDTSKLARGGRKRDKIDPFGDEGSEKALYLDPFDTTVLDSAVDILSRSIVEGIDSNALAGIKRSMIASTEFKPDDSVSPETGFWKGVADKLFGNSKGPWSQPKQEGSRNPARRDDSQPEPMYQIGAQKGAAATGLIEWKGTTYRSHDEARAVAQVLGGEGLKGELDQSLQKGGGHTDVDSFRYVSEQVRLVGLIEDASQRHESARAAGDLAGVEATARELQTLFNERADLAQTWIDAGSETARALASRRAVAPVFTGDIDNDLRRARVIARRNLTPAEKASVKTKSADVAAMRAQVEADFRAKVSRAEKMIRESVKKLPETITMADILGCKK